MNKTRRAMRASLLVLGLTLATCGGQTESGVESAAVPPPVLADSIPAAREMGEAASVPAEGENEPSPLPLEAALSPLAEQVIELPSAFPERVFDGLGEPIGVPPEAMSLPYLGVSNAQVVPVGLETNGELEVPGADQVGWYRFGAGVDGGRGSTVLAAHIAYNGRDGVFRRLADSTVGEEITVERGREVITYRIESVTQYNKQQLPIDDLFSEESEERVVLITCGGTFNPGLSSYDDNVVVIAIPV